MLAVVALTIVGGTAAQAAADPYNTGVTVNPLKAACEVNAPTCNNVGTTNAYFNGEDVKLLYSQNYFCDTTVTKASPSSAANGCEAGVNYNKLPPGTATSATDPLYIPIPLFKTPAVYVQCQATPMCIDHPANIDLSRLSAALGAPASALYNAMLPGHDHIITTRNADQPEWWPIVAVGVTSPSAWTAITTAKDYATMKALEGVTGSGVTGEIPTNVFLWFQTLPGQISTATASTNSTAVPPAAANGQAIDNLTKDCGTSATGCNNPNDYIGQTRAWLGDANTAQGSSVNLLYSSPFFCDGSVQKAGANPCEAGQKANKLPPDITSASFTDPLYIPTPLFTQPVNDLQCPTGLPCIDHPMSADLSRLATTLGHPASALVNFPLPGHDHIITTRNSDQPEWWPVTVIGVTNPQSFALITQAKSYAEVKALEANPANGVLEVPTNIYLFFQTVPGTGASTAAFNPVPVGAPNTGGGGTAGLHDTALIGVGLGLLFAGAGAGSLAYRRRRKAA
ncbi:MAG: hypothetical protein M3N95_12595 [Actinomycetota bacterium]|nr:hypothetical protein [Actinomycetota bacterium]